MLLASCALGGAGCGGSETAPRIPAPTGRAQQKPAAVVKAMAAALRHVHSYHYEGTLSTSKGSARIHVDAARKGRLRLGIKTSQGAAEVIVIPPTAYLRADAGFWRTTGYPSIAEKLGDHWVRTPRETAAGVMRSAEEVTPRHLANCARHARRLQFGGTTTVDGKDAMIIIEERGPGDAPTAVYVPLRGRPLPLRMVTSHPPPAGRPHSPCSPIEQGFTKQDITFSRFNDDIKVDPPAHPLVLG
jgi:hypothetical protein